MNNIKSYKNTLSRLKTTVTVMFTAIGLLYLHSSHATKICVVNVQDVMASMPETQTAEQHVKNKQKKMEDNLTARKNEIRDLHDKMKKARNKQEKGELNEQLSRLTQDAERYVIDSKNTLNILQRTLLARIQKKIKENVSAAFSKYNCTVTFDTATPGLLLFDNDIDITEHVKNLNNK